MMAAGKVLLCFIFLIIAFPVFVEEDKWVSKREFVCAENITTVTTFDEIQLYPHLLLGLFYKVYLVTICAALFLFICYQLRDVHRNECERSRVFEIINRTNEKTTEVLKFYKETEDMFLNLETKSGSLKSCKLRMETAIDFQPISPLQTEVFELKKKLERQQEIFARYGIDLDGSKHTCDSITAELTIASAFVVSQVRRIERDVAEDALTLEGVQKDSRILRVYFGK